MYIPPKCCPNCGSKKDIREVINIFTTGIPLANGVVRFSLGAARGTFRPRFHVTYRCEHCGFQGKYDDRKETWVTRRK